MSMDCLASDSIFTWISSYLFLRRLLIKAHDAMSNFLIGNSIGVTYNHLKNQYGQVKLINFPPKMFHFG